MESNNRDKVLVVEHLSKEFSSTRRLFDKKQPSVKAVNDVSFFVKEGETLWKNDFGEMYRSVIQSD